MIEKFFNFFSYDATQQVFCSLLQFAKGGKIIMKLYSEFLYSQWTLREGLKIFSLFLEINMNVC